MLRLGAAIILALLLSPLSAHAELWRCHQADGSDVFTDKLTDPSTCQQYQAAADVTVVPSSSTTTLSEVAPSRRAFTQQELDQMLAPIALYTDSLLTQILMASTYPLEVVEAARWSRANPSLKGDEAVRAVEQNTWDPSVKSLVAFPQILRKRGVPPDTPKPTARAGGPRRAPPLGGGRPRQKLFSAPSSDPWVFGGRWWGRACPPVYWAPWPGYFVGPGFGVGFVWGVGVTVGAGFFFGAFDWPHRHVTVVNVNNFYFRTVNVNRVTVWQHDPIHRRGVLYRDASLRQQFRRMSASPEVRRDFRGHEPSSFEGRREFGTRPETRGGPGSRLEERGSPGGLGARPNMGSPPGRSNVPDARRSDARSAPSRPSVPSGVSPPHFEQRPHAFEGVGRGADVRNFSARGHASFQGSAPRSSGGSHGGGGIFHP